MSNSVKSATNIVGTNHNLRDLHNREFNYLRLSITDVCNFKCSYCLPDGYKKSGSEKSSASPQGNHPKNNGFLTQKEITAIVLAFAMTGTTKIRLTGGEPTVRKDLEAIVRICAQTPGIKHIAMTSNGYKLAKRLPELVKSGLTALNISIDSLEAETFAKITGHDVLDSVMESVVVAKKLGLKVKVNAVLLKQNNANAFHDFLAFVKKNNITMRFIELMQTGDNNVFFSNQHLRGESIKQQLLADGWVQRKRSKTAGPAQEFIHHEYAGSIGLIMPYSKDFCDTCNRLRVSSTGKLHLCLFAEASHDLRETLLACDYRSDAVASALQLMLYGKGKAHNLHDGKTGITTHLAMLGG